jgi:hypothetical protein
MPGIPPVFLVLDISALSTATPREWLEFSRVGSCIVPQAVYEEMKFLFDRSPDPDLERIARDFHRFQPTSGWQISDASAHHTLLKSGAGQALTKRARISLAVGRCAYALSQNFPASLVVLVNSDRSMLQRIHDIEANNLCAITCPSLLQWCRTGQHPITVSQKLQQLRVAASVSGNSAIKHQPTSPSRITSSPSRITSTSASGMTAARRPLIKPAKSTPSWVSQAVSLTSATLAVLVAGWLIIHVVQTQNFQKIWNAPPSSTQ